MNDVFSVHWSIPTNQIDPHAVREARKVLSITTSQTQIRSPLIHTYHQNPPASQAPFVTNIANSTD